MSIKIYSGYEEFKYEESDLCEYFEEEGYNEIDFDEEESDEIFFIQSSNTNFGDSSTFYVVSDLEDEENAEDISGYLGKFKRIDLPDINKVLFCIN